MTRENASDMRNARMSLAHWSNARLSAALAGWREGLRRRKLALAKLQGFGRKLAQLDLLRAWNAWQQYCSLLNALKVKFPSI